MWELSATSDEEETTPSFENFIRNYQESIKATHPLLSFIIDNTTEFMEIQKNSIIFEFCKKLMMTVNYKMSSD